MAEDRRLVTYLVGMLVGILVGALLWGWEPRPTINAIRADLAQQGCVLVLEDAGEGQTWRVVCEGEGR